MTDLPRALLVTRWPPGARYAGAEALRRVVRALPTESVRWATLASHGDGVPVGLPECRGFPGPALHWRLRDGWFQLLRDDMRARRTAAEIAAWIRPFDPEVVWVLPELAAINVAFYVGIGLGIPLHATVYDAPESARDVCLSPLYYPLYCRAARRLYGRLSSFDAISPELCRHIQNHFPSCGEREGMALPPLIPASWVSGPRAGVQPRDGTVRLALCGALRVGAGQWQRFVNALGACEGRFEVEAFAWQDSMPSVEMPSNVTVRCRPYLEREQDLLKELRDGGYAAAYLGLWREARRRLFVSTSLSSKLVTYAAAGLPVLYDGPDETVVWRLLSQYGGGVMLPANDAGAVGALRRVLGDDGLRSELARGMGAMCASEFLLEERIGSLIDLIARSAVVRHPGEVAS